MPPRKSKDASAAVQAPGVDMAEVENGTPSGKGKEKEKDKGKDKDEEGISIEDLSLPRTMVQRLAKGSLPANTQIQKDAVTAMSKSATLFVNYLAESAHTHTTHASRRTIQPDDVFLALKDTEFDAFIPKLQAELKKYNEIQTGKRNEYRKKVKEGTLGVGSKIAVALGAPGTRKSDVEGLKGEEGSEAVAGDGGDDEEGRSKKRARLEGEDGDVSMADASALNGAKLRESSGSRARIPQVIDDSDADDRDEGVGEQGMGSEAGDSIPNSGSETESLNQDEEEDEEGSEGGRGEEEDEEDEDENSVVGAAGGGDETEEDSEGRDGSEEGGRANGSALPRTVLVAMPRGKEGR